MSLIALDKWLFYVTNNEMIVTTKSKIGIFLALEQYRTEFLKFLTISVLVSCRLVSYYQKECKHDTFYD